MNALKTMEYLRGLFYLRRLNKLSAISRNNSNLLYSFEFCNIAHKVNLTGIESLKRQSNALKLDELEVLEKYTKKLNARLSIITEYNTIRAAEMQDKIEELDNRVRYLMDEIKKLSADIDKL